MSTPSMGVTVLYRSTDARHAMAQAVFAESRLRAREGMTPRYLGLAGPRLLSMRYTRVIEVYIHFRFLRIFYCTVLRIINMIK